MPTKQSRKPLILIAEDDEDYREYVCSILGTVDYELMPVSDGGAAMDFIDTLLLEPMSAHLPDVLVTDLHMPCCDGLIVLRYAKYLPTIAMTAFGDATTYARFRRCGADFVFDKPLNVRTFRSAVEALVH